MDKLDQIDPRQLLLKRGARQLAKACGGDEAAGSIVSRSGETVRRWGDPNFPETIPVWHVVALEAECGMPIVSRILAEMSGHGLVPLDGQRVESDLIEAHTDFLIAAAECSLEVLEARRDGVLTPNEQAGIIKQGLKVKEQVGAMLKAASAPPNAAPPAAGLTLFKKPGL